MMFIILFKRFNIFTSIEGDLMMKKIVVHLVFVLCGLLLNTVVFAQGVSLRQFEYAAEKSDYQRFSDLIELDNGNTLSRPYERTKLLKAAVRSGDTRFVQALLDKGININEVERSDSGKVFLPHEDLLMDTIPLVDIGYGLKASTSKESTRRSKANKNIKKTADSTPDKGIKMIDFLIEKGFKPTDSAISMIRAVEANKFGLAKYLYQKGANILVESEDGTLLHITINQTRFMNESQRANVREFLEFLVDTGKIDINAVAKNRYESTALFCAYSVKDLKLVEYLISKGARNIKAGGLRGGITPLEAAINAGNIEMAKVLKKAN